MNHVEIGAFCIELPLLAFHLSVFAFIAAEICQGNRGMVSTFYYVYAVQSCVDSVNYLTMVSMFRLGPAGIIPMRNPWATVGYTVIGYCTFFQFISHTTIAVNRFIAITKVHKYQSVRTVRMRLFVVMIVALSPLPGTILRWNIGLESVETQTGIAYVTRNPTLSDLTNVVSTAYSALTCTLSFVLELRTLLAYRRLPDAIKRERRADYRLLSYAFLQLTAQVLLTCYYLVSYAATKFDQVSVTANAQKSLPFLIDLLSLSGSICLLVTSGTVRKNYLRFYGLSSASVSEWQTTRTFSSIRY